MAADLPKGDEKRRAILAGLREAFVIDLMSEDEGMSNVDMAGAMGEDDEAFMDMGGDQMGEDEEALGSSGTGVPMDDEEAFVIDNVASDRSTLIRMAADLPKGDEKRRAILAGLGKTTT
jgi:hypothetical protein